MAHEHPRDDPSPASDVDEGAGEGTVDAPSRDGEGEPWDDPLSSILSGDGGAATLDDLGNAQSPAKRATAKRTRVNKHDWVVRTPNTDRLSTSTRLSAIGPLLHMYAVRSMHLRYRQSALGFAWTIVQPLFILAIYGVVFNIFLEVDSGGKPYITVAWTGIAAWMFVQASVQQATVSLRNDAYMLDKLWFPREIIPFAPVLAGLVDLGVAGAILVLLLIFTGIGFSIQVIAVVPVIALLVLYVAAGSVLAATITVFFRDMATIVALGMRLVFIGTPVMYTAATVPQDWKWVNAANPFAVVVLNLRTSVLDHQWPEWSLIGIHGVIGIGLLAFGIWYLQSVERRMVDVI